jgi:hypothetical protein
MMMKTKRPWLSLGLALMLLLSGIAAPPQPARAQAPVDDPSAGATRLFLPMTSKGFNASSSIAVQRTVNIPFFSTPGSDNGLALNDDQWTESGLVWFGRNQQGPRSQNYADVRIGYSALGLHIRVTPIDYYLWYPDDPPSTTDLTQWDTIAVHLDTSGSRAGAPQPSSYQFMNTARLWVNPSKPDQYRREARGTGGGWNMAWAGAWTETYGMVWSSNPGPNNNGGTLDYGGDVNFILPWATLGQGGPPAPGTLWTLSVVMYDRDGPSSADVLPRVSWPELAEPNAPATWGNLRFGRPNYGGTTSGERGRAIIRNASSNDRTVQDAWVGGGGNCSGGHNGGSDVNNGLDTSNFVASQALSADFPCFSRTYLKFTLGAVPSGVQVISAVLTLMQWGGAGAVPEVPTAPKPSYLQVFSIAEDWSETGVTWNNGPMALENVSGTWMAPRAPGADPLTGDPTNLDVTALVRQALESGKPLNVAVYSADTGFHSSKYLGSSQVADQYTHLRPTLTVVWGN